MNEVFFHPKLVHLPIALATLMPLVAGGLIWAWWRDWLPARSWALAVALQAVLVCSGLVAIQSGEAEEDRVEQLVPEHFIEAHAEAAELFVWGSSAVLCLMLVALLMARKRAVGLALAGASLAGTVLVFVLGFRTGEAGGALVYEHGAANAYVQEGRQIAPTPWGQVVDDEDAAEYDDDDD